jgi:hypothetical protein
VSYELTLDEQREAYINDCDAANNQEIEPAPPSVWVVTVPSAYRLGHQCYLGRGLTKQAALEDAYGPRQQWGNNTRKSMRIASVYSTDPDTADEIEHSR